MFDKDFVSPVNLQEMLLYFPELNTYLKPDWVMYRYPLLPVTVQGNEALRCSASSSSNSGSSQSSVATIHTIPVQEASSNNHIIYADVQLNLEDGIAKAKMQHEMHGIMGSGYRPVFILGDKEMQEQTIEDLMNLGSKSDKVRNGTTKNATFEAASDEQPLVIQADVETTEMLEKAGPDYLLKIGKVIGKQVEMYQERERVTDIDIDFLHHLRRYITVTIPEGYTVKNLENLNIDIKQGPSGKRFGFLSSYKLEGNKLIIEADEWYCEMHTPKAEIDAFKAVINAAADFEKATILLEKK
jgi:hypothetical protein